jgi:hypothetical protein
LVPVVITRTDPSPRTVVTRGPRRQRAAIALALVVTAACPPPAGTAAGEAPPAADAQRDTVAAGMIPAGFGTLRQEDVALTIQTGRLVVRAIPLDEATIRVLAPDTYRSLHDVRESRRGQIDELARRYGVRGFSVWLIRFFALEPDVRFTPTDVVISSVGRDFRPVDLIPITPGFGQNRLQQREVQSAIYLFDDAVDVNQPLVVTVESVRNTAWQETQQRIQRERALIRSRAGGAIPPPR